MKTTLYLTVLFSSLLIGCAAPTLQKSKQGVSNQHQDDETDYMPNLYTGNATVVITDPQTKISRTLIGIMLRENDKRLLLLNDSLITLRKNRRSGKREVVWARAYAVDDHEERLTFVSLMSPKGYQPAFGADASTRVPSRTEGKANLIKIHKGENGFVVVEAGSTFCIFGNRWVITEDDVIMNTGQEIISIYDIKLGKNDCARIDKNKYLGMELVDKNSTGAELSPLR